LDEDDYPKELGVEVLLLIASSLLKKSPVWGDIFNERQETPCGGIPQR